MTTVTALLAAISGIGRDARSGGYARPVFSTAERDLRDWFVGEAAQRGLEVEVDRNGILWAWWGTPGAGAVVTGSHLDSVPGGGAFDGPLGIAAALAAVDVLRARGVVPVRPLAVAVFPEEEGSRFGVACLGSRLLTGALSPDAARALTDRDGNTLADVFAASGVDPRWIGADRETLARVGVFVELHVEQGRGLIDRGRPFAVAESILGHGRFKVSVRGEGNHAGTTLMSDRRDPVVAAAAMVGAIAELAASVDDARATVGRFEPVPGGTNVIASSVDFWIDARHPDDAVTRRLIADIDRLCGDLAAVRGCEAALAEESWSPTVGFDPALARRLSSALADAPHLRTGAGHDAGILASAVPTGMLFVRNPSGISHSPDEYVTDADADASATALADVLQELVS
ncbi:allantoate amidohydrolase [Microbacterium hominis]|uniref:Allantoate amidohydrolase n=1 Tax=Microbacterium hominis TaxID=162426 RepID=A0A0B4CN46_9MICO|nr:allantoate amidohydrolase [Microbacterium hominis]KIC57912.1 allantoate amidohydrolase [Microbacterium hominis]